MDCCYECGVELTSENFKLGSRIKSCRPCNAARARAWRARNRERAGEISRDGFAKFYASNAEALAEKSRAYHARFAEQIKEQRRIVNATRKAGILIMARLGCRDLESALRKLKDAGL